MNSQERTELIGPAAARVHQRASFAEGLLTLTQQLLEALEGGRERPSDQDLAEMRAGLERSRAAVDGCVNGSRRSRRNPHAHVVATTYGREQRVRALREYKNQPAGWR